MLFHFNFSGILWKDDHMYPGHLYFQTESVPFGLVMKVKGYTIFVLIRIFYGRIGSLLKEMSTCLLYFIWLNNLRKPISRLTTIRYEITKMVNLVYEWFSISMNRVLGNEITLTVTLIHWINLQRICLLTHMFLSINKDTYETFINHYRSTIFTTTSKFHLFR